MPDDTTRQKDRDSVTDDAEPMSQSGSPQRPDPAEVGAPAKERTPSDRGVASWWRRLTKTSWWRRTFADNFSLEHELDAKIDRLRILLESLPNEVAPALTSETRVALEGQLDTARSSLDGGKPFERVMQRINFVEAEIMMRLSDEHLNLALDALRAEARISLPDEAAQAMLDEIDKLATSTEKAATRKAKIVSLKARLGASVIELFRGSERARDAIWILSVALVVLTVLLANLFYRDTMLTNALFTHYGTSVILEPKSAGTGTVTGANTTGGSTNQPGSKTGTEAKAAPPPRDLVNVIPNGQSPLIPLAFHVLLLAALFGGIGACLSALFSFTLQNRVPNEYEGWFRTLIRPVIGLASGFLAVFILRSGLLTFGDDLAWVAIAALALGFSERLFMGTMQRLEGLPK